MKRTVWAVLVAAVCMLMSGCYGLPKHVPSYAMMKKSQPVMYICAQDIIPRESVKPIYFQVDTTTKQIKAIPPELVAAVVGQVIGVVPEVGKLQAESTRNLVRRNVEFYVSGYTNPPDGVEIMRELKVILNRPFGAVIGVMPDDMKPGE